LLHALHVTLPRGLRAPFYVYTMDQVFFFFNDTATTEIYTLSLHDALPILAARNACNSARASCQDSWSAAHREQLDRKSTRLNSSHSSISYAVFCLKKYEKRRPEPIDYLYMITSMGHVHKELNEDAKCHTLSGTYLTTAQNRIFFLWTGDPPRPPLFPYTALFD